jgi:hypothetical protein
MDSLENDDLKSTAIQAWLDLVYGGQDTREWTLAMRVIRQALEAVPDNIKYRPTSLF